MNDLINDLASVIVDTHEHTGETQPKYAYLGYGPSPSDPIAVDGSPQPREVWYWRDTIEGRETGTAILRAGNGITFDELAGYKNVRVKIGKPAAEKTEHVLWIDSHEGYNALSGRTPDEQKANAAGYPTVDRVATWRASFLTGMVLQVDGPYMYIRPSTGTLQQYDTQTIDLTGNIPGSANQHRLVLVTFSRETGLLVATSGAAVTAQSGSVPSRAEFVSTDYTAISPANSDPIAFVYLYNGQTAGADTGDPATDDIRRTFDPRQIFSASPYVQATVATTDATATTLYTFTIPTSTTYAISAKVVARRTGGSSGTAEDGAYYERSAAIKNVAGTATVIGSVATIATMEDQVGWDCTIDVTGATARVRVTGAVSNNISWIGTFKVYQVSS